jgi:hypothetical protein
MTINKSLYYLGIGFTVLFLLFLMIKDVYEDKPRYTLIIYNYSGSHDELKQDYFDKIKDTRNRISGYSIGGGDAPDERIYVLQAPLFVLLKLKNREIVFVTDNINKLSDFVNDEK